MLCDSVLNCDQPTLREYKTHFRVAVTDVEFKSDLS